MNSKKYYCDKCIFGCDHKSRWLQHLETGLHKTGVIDKKTRSDKKYPMKCKHCEEIIKNSSNMKQHILNFHSTKEERKLGFKYYCEYCDFGTFAKSFYDKHNTTSKHKAILAAINNKNNK
jgi:hypothetical protein